MIEREPAGLTELTFARPPRPDGIMRDVDQGLRQVFAI